MSMSLARRFRHRNRPGVRRWPLALLGAVLAAGAALATALARGADSDVILVVSLAALAGLLIGLVAVWVVGRRTAVIRGRRDLAKLTPAPILAVVPRHPLGAERPEDVVMIRDPNAIDAEAYRTLRTAFEFVADRPSRPDGRGTVVLVTSPRPGEGKSSVAANLAAASAMAGRRVTLVDGDLRKPQIHRLFKLSNDVGLATLISAGMKVGKAVQRLEISRNLVVLTAGPPPPNPAEVLADNRLGVVLDALANASDLVVVDAPPLLAVADPTIIVQHCDVALMVATADLSTKREWAEALARLAVVDATVIGTVLLEPDDRIRAVPTYRYAPSAVPQNWWVTPSTPVTDDGESVGLRVIGGTGVRDLSGASRTDPAVNDEWPEHPTGH